MHLRPTRFPDNLSEIEQRDRRYLQIRLLPLSRTETPTASIASLTTPRLWYLLLNAQRQEEQESKVDYLRHKLRERAGVLATLLQIQAAAGFYCVATLVQVF